MICSNSMYLIFQPFLLSWRRNPAFLDGPVSLEQSSFLKVLHSEFRSVITNCMARFSLSELLPLKSVCNNPNYLLSASSVVQSAPLLLLPHTWLAIPSQSPPHPQVIIDPSLRESHQPFHAAQHTQSDILDSVLDHGLWCAKSC